MAYSTAFARGHGVAVIGVSPVSIRRMRLYEKLGRRVTAVYTHQPNKTRELFRSLGFPEDIPVFDSIANFWKHEPSSYVYVASPCETRSKYVIEAVLHERDVMVEPLMALNITDLALIQQNIVKTRRIVMEANPALNSPLLSYLGRIVKNGSPFGDIGVTNSLFVSIGKGHGGAVPGGEGDREILRGALFDLGYHAVSAVVALAGCGIELINSYQDRPASAGGMDMNSNFVLKNGNGIVSIVNVSYLSSMPDIIDVGAEKGYYCVRDFISSQRYDVMLRGKAAVEYDLNDFIVREYDLDFTCDDEGEYNAVAEILNFEKALDAGYDGCLAGDLNKMLESKTVVRILNEIRANSR